MLGLAIAGGVAPATAAKSNEKMNIVLLFVDDLGWADVGFRNPKFDTPNTDQLFRDGMSFERAYVGQPASSASRASLMTGMEPVRTGVVRHIENKDAASGRKYNMWDGDPTLMPSLNYLPLEFKTYAERMSELGYYNMFVGKWHLGEPEYWAEHQGFDEVWGESEFGNVSDYFAPFFKYPKGEDTTKDTAKKGEFMTDYLTDKAVEMIENYDKDQPFMMSFSYYNVHTPNQGRPELVEHYMKRGMSRKDANYAAQVAVVDKSVGQIRKAIEDKGISDNTVIIYFSDQGGYFTNYPLRGRKDIHDTLAEGGIRVPMAVYYPGVTKAGSTTEVPVQAIDFFPTFVEIAGGNPKSDKLVNGVSLMPLLKGKTIKERDIHFFRAYIEQYAAMIDGNWKIIKYMPEKDKMSDPCTYEMYNITNDMSETTDLQKMYPERFEAMKKRLRAWEVEAVPEYKNDYRKRYNF